MKKKMMTLAAIICSVMAFTSCAGFVDAIFGSEDYPSGEADDSSLLVGKWYSDVSGSTYALWNYGKCWQVTEFKADGTGTIDIYYLQNDQPIGVEHYAYTYTAKADGSLSMNINSNKTVPSTQWRINGGKLTLTDSNDVGMTFTKADGNMAAQFEAWSRQQLKQVPEPARYTVLVYGNAQGPIDFVIEEGFWERVKPLLKDPGNVRVVCLYKYGIETVGKYGKSGDIVWFELNDKTDLNNLTDEHGLQTLFGDNPQAVKLCDPRNLRKFFEFSSLICPAEEYILTTWGHGKGFDPMDDSPGKYVEAPAATRGLISDEWNDYEKLDMYELAEAIKGTRPQGSGRLNTIFFHNCLMGNMEFLTELRNQADYIIASAHNIYSNGNIVIQFIRSLQETDNTEDAMSLMLNRVQTTFPHEIEEEALEGYYPSNGDLKMIRTDAIDGIIAPTKRLADRLIALYPTQQEAIDRATSRVYRFYTGFTDPDDSWYCPFFDLADYAHKLAEETGDAEMASISEDIDLAFKNAFVHYTDINFEGQHLDHYTLSVILYYDFDYTWVWSDGTVFGTNYELSTFHQLTGWGNWLGMNQQMLFGNPTSGSKK